MEFYCFIVYENIPQHDFRLLSFRPFVSERNQFPATLVDSLYGFMIFRSRLEALLLANEHFMTIIVLLYNTFLASDRRSTIGLQSRSRSDWHFSLIRAWAEQTRRLFTLK